MLKPINNNELSFVEEILSVIFDQKYAKKIIKGFFDNQFLKAIGYYQQQQLIAVLIYQRIFDEIEIEVIAVVNDCRRLGYGQKIFDYMLSIEKDLLFIRLEVNVNNSKALSFYQKNDFEIIRKRSAYYDNQDDAYEMLKKVKKMKKIIAIESSCDETACAIVDEGYNVLSGVVTSQIDVHRRFGGVIPEVASRMHVEQISTIVSECLNNASLTMKDIDYVAYTVGPGLIGSLHIGAIAAKTLSFFYDKPLIGVHHLKGHIFVNQLVEPLKFPLIAMVVSGGHTELVLMKDSDSYDIIGTTLDDAIGEAYDKVARVLGMEYPGGPKIDQAASRGKPNYSLPTPKVDGYNFSFSGLKNATIQLVNKLERNNQEINKDDLAYAFQETALNILVSKTIKAVQEYNIELVVLAGGVACNSRLRELAQNEIAKYCHVIVPPMKFTTDNAVMIGCAAVNELKHQHFVGLDKMSMPSMPIDE